MLLFSKRGGGNISLDLVDTQLRRLSHFFMTLVNGLFMLIETPACLLKRAAEVDPQVLIQTCVKIVRIFG